MFAIAQQDYFIEKANKNQRAVLCHLCRKKEQRP